MGLVWGGVGAEEVVVLVRLLIIGGEVVGGACAAGVLSGGGGRLHQVTVPVDVLAAGRIISACPPAGEEPTNQKSACSPKKAVTPDPGGET